jgi:hypothetical protein
MLRILLLSFLDSLLLSLYWFGKADECAIVNYWPLDGTTINTVVVNFEKYVLVLLKSAKQQRTTNSIVRFKHSNVLLRNG